MSCLRLRTLALGSLAAILAGPPASPAQSFPPSFFNGANIARGRELAPQYCGGCHQLPTPDILDRETWISGAMPWMMMVLGMEPRMLPPGRHGEMIRNSGGILTAPLMPRENWWPIVAYYIGSAPRALAATNSAAGLPLTDTFATRRFLHASATPMALLTQFDRSSERLFIGDATARELILQTTDGGGAETLVTNLVPVAVHESEAGLWITGAGSFNPTEDRLGSVLFASREGLGYAPARPILTGLPRTTHTLPTDLNGDNRQDLIVSMFGWYSGRLSWFEGLADGRYREHVLFEKPGTLRTETADLNGDGHLDIIALVAQSTESLLIFLGDGKGGFELRTAWRKHPSFGHSNFTIADFNRDGRPDLLTCNGDNGDYRSPIKPYHGIRLYHNEGDLKFVEALFLPMPGAFKAIPHDFDLDGDLDIAAISYYPDYSRTPTGSFILFRNDGDLRFTATTIADAEAGRWISMDAADIDDDGDMDLALGSAIKGPGRKDYVPSELTRRWASKRSSVLILENRSKH